MDGVGLRPTVLAVLALGIAERVLDLIEWNE